MTAPERLAEVEHAAWCDGHCHNQPAAAGRAVMLDEREALRWFPPAFTLALLERLDAEMSRCGAPMLRSSVDRPDLGPDVAIRSCEARAFLACYRSTAQAIRRTAERMAPAGDH